MKYTSKGCRSALVIQIMLIHINAMYSIHLIPQDFLQYSGRNSAIYQLKYPIVSGTYYQLQGFPIKGKSDIYFRTPKSDKTRMFSIDLSELRQNIPVAHNTAKQKSPMNLLGIDISVLSQNPDPAIPVEMKPPKDILNEKFVMGYGFDSKYDRLPVITTPIKNSKDITNGKFMMGYNFNPQYDRLPTIKTRPKYAYSSMSKENTKAMLPVMHLPLKVMTTYSILTNKKHDTDFQLNNGRSSNIENEQRNTANFLSHLLHQLSSDYNNASEK